MNLELEMLAMVLTSDKVIPVFRSKGIKPEWFTTDFYRDVCEAVYSLNDEGKPVDPLAIKERVDHFDRAMWDDLLRNAEWISPQNAEAYADTFVREVTSRKIIELLQEGIANLSNQQDPYSVGSEINERINDLICGKITGTIRSTYDVINSMFNQWEKIQKGERFFVKTGYPDLDRILGGGLIKKGLYIMAARPGGGKTAFAVNMAKRMADEGQRVLYVSLEMSAEQLEARILAPIADRSATQILNREFDEKEYKKLLAKIPDISLKSLSFTDIPNVKVSDVVFYARQSQADVVIVDYLGLLAMDGGKSIYEKVTATSKAMKQAAMSLGIPVLCLAQLNREVEKRANGKPNTSDLRDSGALEQDADGVLLLQRISDSDEDEINELHVHIGKNRHGPVGGKVELGWTMRTGSIWEIDEGKVAQRKLAF